MSKSSKYITFKIEQYLVPLFIMGFCVISLVISFSFKEMPPILKRGMQPAYFPQLLLVLLIVLTAMMAWLDPVRVYEKIGKPVWGTIILMGAFCFLMRLDLFLALGSFAVGLSAFWGERRLSVLILVGVVIPLTIFFFLILYLRFVFPMEY